MTTDVFRGHRVTLGCFLAGIQNAANCGLIHLASRTGGNACHRVLRLHPLRFSVEALVATLLEELDAVSSFDDKVEIETLKHWFRHPAWLQASFRHV